MSKLKSLYTTASFSVLGVLMSAASAKAIDLTVPTVQPDTSGGTLRELLGNIVDIVLIVVSVIAVLYLVWGGVQYITAGGDADKASKGRVTITNAIIGIIIIIAAFVIYRVAAGAASGASNSAL